MTRRGVTVQGRVGALAALTCAGLHVALLPMHLSAGAAATTVSALMLLLALACLPCAGMLWRAPTPRAWAVVTLMAGAMLTLHALLASLPMPMTPGASAPPSGTVGLVGHAHAGHGLSATTLSATTLIAGTVDGQVTTTGTATALMAGAMLVALVQLGLGTSALLTPWCLTARTGVRPGDRHPGEGPWRQHTL